MGYQIYGYVQIKKENKWITAPVYHKESTGNFEPVTLWHSSEVGRYLWQKAAYATEDEAKDFIQEMGYDEEDRELLPIKAISLAYMKYIALTFDPDHNDYDDSGDEDRIKPGLERMSNQVEAVVDLAEFYGNLDEVRFIFYESY